MQKPYTNDDGKVLIGSMLPHCSIYPNRVMQWEERSKPMESLINQSDCASFRRPLKNQVAVEI